MNKIGILTGGGDCPGLNAVIRAVVKKSRRYDWEVIGIKNGWKGLIDGEMELLSDYSVSGILPKGGTIIGFDGKKHRTIQDGVVVFDKEKIIHVGKSYQGDFDKKVDAKKKLVTPGFINTHCHAHTPLSPHHLTVDIPLDPFYQHAGIGMHIARRGATREPLSAADSSKIKKLIEEVLVG